MQDFQGRQPIIWHFLPKIVWESWKKWEPPPLGSAKDRSIITSVLIAWISYYFNWYILVTSDNILEHLSYSQSFKNFDSLYSQSCILHSDFIHLVFHLFYHWKISIFIIVFQVPYQKLAYLIAVKVTKIKRRKIIVWKINVCKFFSYPKVISLGHYPSSKASA